MLRRNRTSPSPAGVLRFVVCTLRATFPPQPEHQLPRDQPATDPPTGATRRPNVQTTRQPQLGTLDTIVRATPGSRPPASPEPTQPGRRTDERGEPLSCSPPLDHRIASAAAPWVHEREHADTRQLGDQLPGRPCRPPTQLPTFRDDACRRSAQMVVRLAVVSAVDIAAVLVCAPVPPPGSAGTITAQPGRPSTAALPHAPGRPTNPLIRRKARPPRTAAAGGMYRGRVQPPAAAGTTRPAHRAVAQPSRTMAAAGHTS